MQRASSEQVVVPAGAVRLPGELLLPDEARGLVVFVHGSGSSRKSPRNRAVAGTLVRAGCATLLFDLLTEREAADRENVFDIPLLATRVEAALAWAGGDPRTRELPIGLFGASTGAAAALLAAARPRSPVVAVVSRGGRPDLAGSALPRVEADTLLLVGGLDGEVLELNRWALRRLTCNAHLTVVPGATHLFEEPGTLERVADDAARWFGGVFEAVWQQAHPAGGPDSARNVQGSRGDLPP